MSTKSQIHKKKKSPIYDAPFQCINYGPRTAYSSQEDVCHRGDRLKACHEFEDVKLCHQHCHLLIC